MINCIIYCILGLGMFATSGCFSGYGTIAPHSVTYTHHKPKYTHGHYRQRACYYGDLRSLRYYYKHKRKYKKRHTRRHAYRKNVYNRTIINRHYYRNSPPLRNNGGKRKYPNQRKGNGKKGKKNKY